MKVEIKKMLKKNFVMSQVVGTATIQGREADILMIPTGTGIRFTDNGDTYTVSAKSIGEVLQKELNNNYEYNTSIQQGAQDSLREKELDELDKEKEVK